MPVRKIRFDGCTDEESPGSEVNITLDPVKSGEKLFDRDHIYIILREAIIASVSHVYTELDTETLILRNDVEATATIEDLHTQLVDTLVKNYSTPCSVITLLEELYGVASSTEELWVKSCEVSDFLTSAIVAYIKLCIYRFGDPGVFSDALNTILI